ncbi:MAG: hypothetical protein ACHRXM_24215 [Isosphaerales bacterium]
MNTCLISVCLLAFPGGSVVSQGPDAPIDEWNKKGYAAAYKVGVAEADKELKEGKATIYAYGLREAQEFLNRKTGVPYKVIAGCEVNREILARAAGHNDRIRKYIEERGLPSNSFKRWDKELFDLKGYYETRTETERPHRLSAGGTGVKSSDGKYRIRLVKTQFRDDDDGSVSDYASVVVSVDGVDHEPLHVLSYEGNVDFFCGPKDSGFAVIRCKGKDKPAFMAVDLKRGRWLRQEWLYGER